MANEIVSFNKAQSKVKLASNEYMNNLFSPLNIKMIFSMICIFGIHDSPFEWTSYCQLFNRLLCGKINSFP